MRVPVDVTGRPPSAGSGRPHRKPGSPPAPCVDPLCRNPARTGGRCKGRCKICDARHRKVMRKAAETGVKPCLDPECKQPFGGRKRYPRRRGSRPARIHGYCRTCWNRRVMRWKRASRRSEVA